MNPQLSRLGLVLVSAGMISAASVLETRYLGGAKSITHESSQWLYQSAAYLRLASTYIENMDWHNCMGRYDRPHTLLFYLDPKYWEIAGYGVDFPLGEYEKMADLMSRIKRKAILSLNYHPDIRRVFARFQMDSTGINYIGGGRELNDGS